MSREELGWTVIAMLAWAVEIAKVVIVLVVILLAYYAGKWFSRNKITIEKKDK